MLTVNLELLKSTVEQSFGRKIVSSSDCHLLCADIYKVCQVKISFNTVRRLFNLMKASRHPSSFTLDTLSIYCNFASFENFIIEHSYISVQPATPDLGLLRFLVILFKQIEPAGGNDQTYFSLIEKVRLILNQYPSIIDQFHREIAKTSNGRKYYFEQGIYIDKLGTYYGTGLQFYLAQEPFANAQIFGYHLLCLRAWLLNEQPAIGALSNKIKGYAPDLTMPPGTYARYLATHIFDAAGNETKIADIEITARKYFVAMLNNKFNPAYVDFGITLALPLLLNGIYEESIFYLDEVARHSAQFYTPSTTERLDEMQLLKAIALTKAGHRSEVMGLYRKIDVTRFHHLSRQYLTLLYLLGKRLLRHNSEDDEQIAYLLKETGFFGLLNLFEFSDDEHLRLRTANSSLNGNARQIHPEAAEE